MQLLEKYYLASMRTEHFKKKRCIFAHVARKAYFINSSYLYSRSERFMFAERQTLHFAPAMLHAGFILRFTVCQRQTTFINSSYLYSQSERFMFAERQTLHFAPAMLHAGFILRFTVCQRQTTPPPPLSKKARYFAAPPVPP